MRIEIKFQDDGLDVTHVVEGFDGEKVLNAVGAIVQFMIKGPAALPTRATADDLLSRYPSLGPDWVKVPRQKVDIVLAGNRSYIGEAVTCPRCENKSFLLLNVERIEFSEDGFEWIYECSDPRCHKNQHFSDRIVEL